MRLHKPWQLRNGSPYHDHTLTARRLTVVWWNEGAETEDMMRQLRWRLFKRQYPNADLRRRSK